MQKLIYSKEEFKERYSLGKHLGGGANGNVFILTDKSRPDGQLAIKIISIEEENKFDESDLLTLNDNYNAWEKFEKNLNEVITSYITDSRYLVKIYNFFVLRGQSKNDSKFCIIMDYYEKSLKSIIHEFLENKKTFSLQQILRVIFDVSLGLLTLKGHNISHRDLKPANIMIDPASNCFKIIDFGESILNFEHSLTADRTQVGTKVYMAPEVLNARKDTGTYRLTNNIPLLPCFINSLNVLFYKFRYNPFSADIFSLGLIAFELCLLDNFDRDNAQYRNFILEMKRNLNANEYNERLEKELVIIGKKYKNEALVNLIRNMLTLDHHFRPKCEDIISILEHGFHFFPDFKETFENLNENWSESSVRNILF